MVPTPKWVGPVHLTVSTPMVAAHMETIMGAPTCKGTHHHIKDGTVVLMTLTARLLK